MALGNTELLEGYAQYNEEDAKFADPITDIEKERRIDSPVEEQVFQDAIADLCDD